MKIMKSKHKLEQNENYDNDNEEYKKIMRIKYNRKTYLKKKKEHKTK